MNGFFSDSDCDDDDLLREMYFEETNDDTLAGQSSSNQVHTEDGIPIMDLRDLPEPNTRDYWNVRLCNIVQKANISRAAHESLIEFCNDWVKSNDYRTFMYVVK